MEAYGVNLKSTSSYFFSKMIYSGIIGEWKFETCKLGKNTGKSGDQRREIIPYQEKEEVVKSCFKGKSIGRKGEFRMMTVSYWLSCGITILAVLVARHRETLPSFCWSSNADYLLLRL